MGKEQKHMKLKKILWFKKSLHLLTDKPILYVGNIGETDLQDKKISNTQNRSNM